MAAGIDSVEETCARNVAARGMRPVVATCSRFFRRFSWRWWLGPGRGSSRRMRLDAGEGLRAVDPREAWRWSSSCVSSACSGAKSSVSSSASSSRSRSQESRRRGARSKEVEESVVAVGGQNGKKGEKTVPRRVWCVSS